MTPASLAVRRTAWRGREAAVGERVVAEEVPVAVVYDGSTHAVMMATPSDLDDFARGFSLTEGVIARADEVLSLETHPHADGIELRLWLVPARRDELARRRRAIVGPTGCGLCGVESLAEASAPPPRVGEGRAFTAREIATAVTALREHQPLGATTRAVHAAAFWTPERSIVAAREDVGRHNALDKLAGALAAARVDPATGILLLTSRVSIELVQKAARIGATVIAAISAPTALALRTAEVANITLIAVARDDGFELFTHPRRVHA